MTQNAELPTRKGLNEGKGIEGPVAQFALYTIMTIIIILVMLPIIITVLMSLKTNMEIAQGVWSLPHTPKWSNYSFGFIGILPNMINSLIVCIITTSLVLFIASLVAYVFTRHNFPGKEPIFYAILALLVIPGVLSLTPSYLLMMKLGLTNSWLALILPYTSGMSVGAIFLFRTFLSQQPEDLFEAGRIDGANEFVMYAKIALPLAIPVLAIQGVGVFSAVYNDLLWPMLVIDDTSKQTLMPVLSPLALQLEGQKVEQGVRYSVYLLSGIPLIVTTMIGLRYFINGDFAAGLKL